MIQPLMYESHSHTPLCKHADGWPDEYALVAEKRGLKGLIVTCHNPMPNGFSASVRMAEDEFESYIELVSRTREQFLGRVDVRLGLEADYFEGMEDYLEQQLQSADFNFVLGSVHPQISEWRERYWQDDLLEVQRTYFHLLAKTAETKLFDSISHPDLIKNFTSSSWDPEKIMPDICRSLDRIAQTGVAMELNTSGVNKTISEMNPMPTMLEEIAKRGIPITLGSDAHVPDRVADGYETGLHLLEESGFSHVSYFLDRQRHELLIEDALKSLIASE
ncbi:MAG: histidinol-phosphatase HisJ family protein [Rubripirellula sp.]|nr:histidinol-phosphatase HisJ family protein [Rubripirellula sp.]